MVLFLTKKREEGYGGNVKFKTEECKM